jgi:hypothetical protein
MVMKTHFEHGPHGNACGRAGRRSTTNVYAVTCLNCQKSDQFLAARRLADDVRHQNFLAQTPRAFREPWKDGNITCRACGGGDFRMGDRTCYGHYENYHCATCGHVESRLTETGMSF